MSLDKFIETRLVFYFAVFGVKCPPTKAQLHLEVLKISSRIMKANLAGILVSVIAVVIAYLNMWKDYNEHFVVFSPLCIVPLFAALIYMLLTMRHVRKLDTLRQDFLPSQNHVMASMNPLVNEYIKALEMNGRDYITNYENSKLFVNEFDLNA